MGAHVFPNQHRYTIMQHGTDSKVWEHALMLWHADKVYVITAVCYFITKMVQNFKDNIMAVDCRYVVSQGRPSYDLTCEGLAYETSL